MDRERLAEGLNEYLDGGLPSVEEAAFAAALGEHQDLLREVELQRAIDASLGRSFAPPGAGSIAASVRTALGAPPASAWPRNRITGLGRWWGVAAAILFACGGYWAWSGSRIPIEPVPVEDGTPATLSLLESIYADHAGAPESAGGVSCLAPESLLERVAQACGGSDELSAEVVIHPVEDPRLGSASCVVVHGGEEPVLVLECEPGTDVRPDPPVTRGFFLHRRLIEDRVHYELSRSPEPVVIAGLAMGPNPAD